MKFRSMILSAAMVALASAAMAQAPAPAAGPACADNKLIIGSGTATGAYAQLMKPLAQRCSMICEDDKTTQGGFDNVTKLIRNEFDGGIAQIDTLQLLSRNYPSLKENVRSLFPLHGSSMHILAMADGFPVTTSTVTKSWIPLAGNTTTESTSKVPITNLQDLRGKPIAAWSSAATTMEIVNAKLNLGMQIVEVAQRGPGLAMLKAGKVAAFVGAGGFPLDWVEKANGKAGDGIAGLVLVDVDSRDIEKLEKPYYPVKVIYRSLGAIGINTIAVRNEMIVRDIQDGERAEAIAQFRACFVQNIRAIKSSRGVHPAWADVSGSLETSWPAYQAAAAPAVAPLLSHPVAVPDQPRRIR